jgi:hypothetical protein
MDLNCEITGCKNLPHVDIMWTGKNQSQTATLCETHMSELWKELNTLLQANFISFRIDGPGKLKKETL